MTDVRYWIWLSLVLGPGSRHTDKLITAFGDAKSIYNASTEELEGMGLSDDIIFRLSDKSTGEVTAIYDYCVRNNVGLLAFDNPCFPARLKRTDNPPTLLYFRGVVPEIDDNVCIAAVGTRLPSEYGKREAYVLSHDLAVGGAVIVSGLARGIDSVCHRACIDASGKTIAVIGSGIDVVYPPENDGLYAEIIANGAIITEFRPGTPPLGHNFPLRNRIISALSLGTLVLEADVKSGALITASYAQKQGRDVFALPGKVGDFNSTGTNSLIKNGARMITDAVDILEEYECLFPHRIRIENLPVFMKRFSIGKPFTAAKQRLSVAEPSAPLPRYENKDKVSRKNKAAGDKASRAKAGEDKDTPKTAVLKEPDTNMLDPKTKEIFLKMTPGEALLPDELVSGETDISDILVAMTLLEIENLVKSLPGGKYVRK